ncbi:TetR/AcrR family transcriptional regulator [Nonomuraea glycinis]|jgi:AcrR family transcriptional regulator|uniref:TetR family transcriptional regulator n=1 Tax=Nonomuraea glycinis TaxID=2047744 RepID=A0A918E7U4_9ACTN|nr:TetR/AcrR family transcriptional regulator [Nonomuraea glycinis]MCA2181265.1 TetR/AcrR family transcriptional regulator [Nonomuraea glycinis]WSG69714.1 TetR/AcrR family transcriptional regulator [Nonomuraea glycinis]GGP13327.1 TetR family transcriptional regulator [Nonomuraea glycinis]
MGPTRANSPQPLRRDAQRNRDALLTAAADAFARKGLQAPLEHVAKEAGVAIGTLYRHFPTRLDLVQTVFEKKFEAWLAAAEEAVVAEDPWEGFCRYLEAMCELQADDQGMNDLASMRLPLSDCIQDRLTRIRELARQAMRRAQDQGTLRPDLTPEDLVFVVWSHSRITAATSNVAPRTWRRHLHLMLDAFRAERAHPLPTPALTEDELRRAMTELGSSTPCAE